MLKIITILKTVSDELLQGRGYL